MAGDDMSEVITRGILRQELEQALQRYATKSDLERFATKSDLERFATKSDLERFATKSDLEVWAGAIMAQTRADFRADLQSALGVAFGQLERNLGLGLEPTKDLPERVTALEGAELPDRVSRLEAKVFPPRRARRDRRG